MKNQETTYPERRLCFEDGFWWYRPSKSEDRSEISSLIRNLKFNPAGLAEKLKLGERTFRRIVTDSLGIPPGTWLRQQRAVAARHRLREGCPVKQIATELGFRHQGDFCVEFKRWYDLSPADFMHAGKESP
jgi:AraC-like DNA-binding protein